MGTEISRNAINRLEESVCICLRLQTDVPFERVVNYLKPNLAGNATISLRNSTVNTDCPMNGHYTEIAVPYLPTAAFHEELDYDQLQADHSGGNSHLLSCVFDDAFCKAIEGQSFLFKAEPDFAQSFIQRANADNAFNPPIAYSHQPIGILFTLQQKKEVLQRIAKDISLNQQPHDTQPECLGSKPNGSVFAASVDGNSNVVSISQHRRK